MSTYAKILTSNFADDAAFRAAGLALSDALTALGLAKTADTGQINWATVLKPTSTSQVMGYEIRTLAASTLQTENPVLIKISYGATSAVTTQMGLTFQVGHTTDGAGAFTGVASTGYLIGSSVATTGMSMFSLDADHFCMALYLAASTNAKPSIVFGVDRLRDINGVALNTGVNVFMSGSATLVYQFVLPSGGGAQFPTTPLVQPMCLFTPNGTVQSSRGAAYCISNLYPFLGYSGNPDLNFIIYNAEADLSPGGTIRTVTTYGVTHSYALVANYIAALNGNGAVNWSIGVRYE